MKKLFITQWKSGCFHINKLEYLEAFVEYKILNAGNRKRKTKRAYQKEMQQNTDGNAAVSFARSQAVCRVKLEKCECQINNVHWEQWEAPCGDQLEKLIWHVGVLFHQESASGVVDYILTFGFGNKRSKKKKN